MSTYKILQNDKLIEANDNYAEASQGYWTLVAHELKNGRQPALEWKAADGSAPQPWLLLTHRLGSWALDVLKQNPLTNGSI